MKKNKTLKTLVGAYVSLSMLACCTIQVTTQVSSRLENEYIDQVVRLQTKSVAKDGPKFSATGFAYTKDLLLTAGHFCLGAIKGQVAGEIQDKISMSYVESGMVKTLDGGLIVALDEKKDLCAIYLPQDKVLPLGLLNRKPRINEKIVITGASLGLFPVIAKGHVVTPKSENPSEEVNGRLVVNSTAVFGNSGGPIINREGKVVGIVMAIPPIFHHLIFAVRAETIQEFIEDIEQYGE